MKPKRLERVIEILASLLSRADIGGPESSAQNKEELAELLVIGRGRESVDEILNAECKTVSTDLSLAVRSVLEMHLEISTLVFQQAESELRELSKTAHRGEAILTYLDENELDMWGPERDNQRLLLLIEDAFAPISSKNAHRALNAMKYDRDSAALERLLPVAEDIFREP